MRRADKLKTSRAIFLTAIPYICVLAAAALIACNPARHEGRTATFQPMGGFALVIPRGDNPAQHLAWSPSNANEILVLAYEEGIKPAEISVIDLAAHETRFLLREEHGYVPEVAWAPDRKRVLLLVGHGSPRFDTPGWYAVDVNGGLAHRLAYPGYTEVKWSPDGALLASSGAGDLLITTLSTGSEHRIFKVAEALDLPGASWSSDSKYLAIPGGSPALGVMDIYVVDVQGGSATKITEGAWVLATAWSPIHKTVAYTTREPQNETLSLHLISADGKCDLEIPGISNPISPTWSPDGRKLAFIVPDAIYVLELEPYLKEHAGTPGCDPWQ